MSIVCSVDDGYEVLVCLSSRREDYVNDSTGKGQYVLRSLKTTVVRREQSKHWSTYLSLLIDLQPKSIDAIDHCWGHLKTMRQKNLDSFTGMYSCDAYTDSCSMSIFPISSVTDEVGFIQDVIHRMRRSKVETIESKSLTWNFLSLNKRR